MAVAVIATLTVAQVPSRNGATAQAQSPPDASDATDGAERVPAPQAGPGQSSWDKVVAPAGSELSAPAAPGSVQATSASVALGGNYRRLHVKLADSSDIRWSGSGFDGGLDEALTGLLGSEPGLVVAPLFDRSRVVLDAEVVQAEAISGIDLPELTNWYLVTVPTSAAGQRIGAALRALDVVEMVQPEPELATTAPLEEERQGYLDTAPGGVDAEWAWNRLAGTGSEVTIAVIDSGFDTNHGDLDRVRAVGVAIPHEPPWDPHHGLQVLGILAADDDEQGIRGIASGAAIRTVNSGMTSGEVANAIELASAEVGPGDVLTISQGICAVPGCADNVVLPLVYSSSARDALKVATARGIITVVSAGNGGANLDGFTSRLGSDAPETIVVGGANPPATAGCSAEDGPARARVAASNYGSRVDLQGWAACVRTATQGGGYRWWGFTSAATPIVAGSAALLSSMAEERLAINLAGPQVRTIFGETGSSQVTAGARGGNVGPLPDVRAAMESLALIPANDMWTSARSVAEFPFAAGAETRWAGVEVDEPAVGCGGISNTVWYSVTPARDLTVDIDTRGSDFDTMLGLWRLDGVELVRVGCNDNVSETDTSSALSRTLSAGETYFAQVGGASGTTGNLRVRMTGPRLRSVGCDVDGDGLGDIVSGSPREDLGRVGNAGRALVHYGSSTEPLRAVTSVSQRWAGLSGDSESGDRFGEAIACGDFNADGYSDLAIGGGREDVGTVVDAGAVRIVPGGPSGPSHEKVLTITQESPGVAGRVRPGAEFGGSFAVGDFNGDGYDDLAIAATGQPVGSASEAGAVHLLYGASDGLRLVGRHSFTGNSAGLPNFSETNDRFGETLAAGDFNFDGFDDLVVGAPSEDLRGRADAGAVWVLPGTFRGTSTEQSVILHQNKAGVSGVNENGDHFGASLTVGDLNGDSYSDLVIGVPNEAFGKRNNVGLIQVFTGGAAGLVGSASMSWHQDSTGVRGRAEQGDRFGSSLAAGDFDGDGYDDVAVGVPGEDVRGVAGVGRVHILAGSPNGPSGTGDLTFTQDSPDVPSSAERGDHFGAVLATTDATGDGYRDLIIGVPHEDLRGKKNAGLIVWIPGGPDGPAPGGPGPSLKRHRALAQMRQGTVSGSR